MKFLISIILVFTGFTSFAQNAADTATPVDPSATAIKIEGESNPVIEPGSSYANTSGVDKGNKPEGGQPKCREEGGDAKGRCEAAPQTRLTDNKGARTVRDAAAEKNTTNPPAKAGDAEKKKK